LLLLCIDCDHQNSFHIRQASRLLKYRNNQVTLKQSIFPRVHAPMPFKHEIRSLTSS